MAPRQKPAGGREEYTQQLQRHTGSPILGVNALRQGLQTAPQVANPMRDPRGMTPNNVNRANKFSQQQGFQGAQQQSQRGGVFGAGSGGWTSNVAQPKQNPLQTTVNDGPAVTIGNNATLAPGASVTTQPNPYNGFHGGPASGINPKTGQPNVPITRSQPLTSTSQQGLQQAPNAMGGIRAQGTGGINTGTFPGNQQGAPPQNFQPGQTVQRGGGPTQGPPQLPPDIKQFMENPQVSREDKFAFLIPLLGAVGATAGSVGAASAGTGVGMMGSNAAVGGSSIVAGNQAAAQAGGAAGVAAGASMDDGGQTGIPNPAGYAGGGIAGNAGATAWVNYLGSKGYHVDQNGNVVGAQGQVLSPQDLALLANEFQQQQKQQQSQDHQAELQRRMGELQAPPDTAGIDQAFAGMNNVARAEEARSRSENIRAGMEMGARGGLGADAMAGNIGNITAQSSLGLGRTLNQNNLQAQYQKLNVQMEYWRQRNQAIQDLWKQEHDDATRRELAQLAKEAAAQEQAYKMQLMQFSNEMDNEITSKDWLGAGLGVYTGAANAFGSAAAGGAI